MKKPALMSFAAVFVVLSLAAQVPAPAPAAKPDERVKNLDLVEKVAPAPDSFKAGFESISAKDSLAMLTYIASDLMEGRETATRGYQAAAEYAASLFGLAHLTPLGDPAMRPFNMMQMLTASPQGPGKPPETTYLQEFPLIETLESSSTLGLEVRKGGSVRTHTFRPNLDYMGFAATGDTISGPVVFVGYGLSEKGAGFDEYKGIDVFGKVVLILPGAPDFLPKDIKAKYSAAPGMTGSAPPPPGGSPQAGPAPVRVDKFLELRKRGPAAILVVRAAGREADRYRALLPRRSVNDEMPIINKIYRRIGLPGESEEAGAQGPAMINLMSGAADRILEAAGLDLEGLKKKIEATKRPASQDVAGASITMTSTVKTQVVRGINVVGMIEGTDPELKKEAIVVGAHLDHTGRWEDYIYNGSDDNGSGSVGVLNLARAFAANPQKPKRTVVFCLWCGEEEGLLGSAYFVKNPPRLLTAKIVSYLNFDMISRTYDEKSIAFAGRMMDFPAGPELTGKIKLANFVPVSFPAGAPYGGVIRAANRFVGLDVYVREAKRTDVGFGDSDHTSFSDAKIPWIWPFTAVTENLHQTSDSVDKASGELMEKVSRLMFVIAWMLADK